MNMKKTIGSERESGKEKEYECTFKLPELLGSRTQAASPPFSHQNGAGPHQKKCALPSVHKLCHELKGSRL